MGNVKPRRDFKPRPKPFNHFHEKGKHFIAILLIKLLKYCIMYAPMLNGSLIF
jgi:hypothetical protein